VIARRCAECGGPIEPSREPLPVELRGERFTVGDIEHDRCSKCGEVFLDLEATQRLQIEAVSRLRTSRDLLTPNEIRELRRSLGLSQAAFEDLLGVGPKTVVRWEKGTVFQSATADRLMRLLAALPEVRALLAGGDLYATPSHTRSTRRRSSGR